MLLGGAWPPVTAEARPWAIWWWPGSAVEESEIAAHLDRYAAAGLGGLHVVPIYGVRGAEAHALPFLDARWVQSVRFTVEAARERGLGIDLTTGTGWPFGGPSVAAGDGSRQATVARFEVAAGGQLAEAVRPPRLPEARLQALMAYPAGDGRPVDLTAKVDPGTRRLAWTAPSSSDRWNLYALFDAPTGMKVKRPAPGGEGRVIDHLSANALRSYLRWIDRGLRGREAPRVRAFTCDSFEDMASDFSGDFLDTFTLRRGYDLRTELPALAGDGDAERAARVVADYRETVSELLLERFARPWTRWTLGRGAKSRYQAHGSPGNLLDLYAEADIAETEAFGPSRLPIPGLRTDPNLPEHFGKPDVLFSRFASSAAHLTGKRLVSAEAATWLGEHFQVAPSQVKPELDRLFLAGVNHVFLHGVTYSPADALWPGWLFYASTDFGPSSGFWGAMPALSAYVARTQAALQASSPDRDLLLYFPVHDLWHERTSKGERLRHLTAHDAGGWLHHHPTGFGRVAQALLDRGVMFDFVSDRLLARHDARPGDVILVPGARRMPPETWRRLGDHARDGARVIFLERLPDDVPGLGRLAEGRRQAAQARAALGARAEVAADLPAALAAAGIHGEPIAAAGVGVLRRRAAGGHLYFLANLGARAHQGWVALATAASGATVMDPLDGRSGAADLRRDATGRAEVFLHLPPGKTLLLRTFAATATPAAPRWRWHLPTDTTVALRGPWQVSFTRGGPALPPPVRMDQGPTPWTALPGEALRAFSGTAVYRTDFRHPGGDGPWQLELANLHATAVVRLNGAEAGTLWALPYQLDVSAHLRPGANTLEIEVTNLPANRVAALARAGAPRVRYHDIDFVDIRYRPFDASGWAPLPSGLEGPVVLRQQRPYN